MESREDKYNKAFETDRFNNLGVAEFNNGNFRMAMSYYKQALNVMPQNDDALINLAICHNKMGNHDECIQLCLKAIQINPDREVGYYQIGVAFYQKSDMPNAIKWLKEAANRGSTSAANWLESNGYF